jgi:DnaK suppressor protein
MVARKKSSRKKTTSKARKSTARKSTPRKSTTRKKVANKTAGKRKSSRKKLITKKNVTRKKGAKKKISKKKVTKKKVAKKNPTRKKTSDGRASRKKISRKTVTKKKTAGKTGAARKKVAKTIAAKTQITRARRTNGAARRLHLKPSKSNTLIHGIAPYRPGKGEEYMSKAQLAHFEAVLKAWKAELMEEADRTVHHMQDEASNFPDPNDRATQESEFGIELRTRDRERKLLKKIGSALARIEDRSYGFCEETGEEIGLQRLEARPVATLCVEAQERREVSELQYSDRED